VTDKEKEAYLTKEEETCYQTKCPSRLKTDWLLILITPRA